MPTYQPRTTSPAGSNLPQYMSNLYGASWSNAWNTSIYGSPTISGADVLANCVGYAQGRSVEIWMRYTGETPITAGNTHPYIAFNLDAGQWYQIAENLGMQRDDEPSLGAIMCTPNHVAICEEKIDDDHWIVSESGYGTMPEFFYQNSLNRVGGAWESWFSSPSHNVLGFIRNPYVTDQPIPPTPTSGGMNFIYQRNWNNYNYARRFQR